MPLHKLPLSIKVLKIQSNELDIKKTTGNNKNGTWIYKRYEWTYVKWNKGELLQWGQR